MSKDYDLPDEVPGSNSYPPCPPRPVFSPPLSRRDRFAMAAMQGILVSLDTLKGVSERWVSQESIVIADALIAELDGGEG